MPQVLDRGADALRQQRTQRRATLFRIERKDGRILRFTDHNHELSVRNEVFVPSAAIDASTRRKADSLRDQGLDAIGAISSEQITEKDLRARRYSGARVYEMVVDWRYPWAGTLAAHTYIWSDTQWTGESFTVQLEGLSNLLQGTIGDVYGRTCSNRLGDANCRYDVGGNSYFDVRVNAASDQRNFDAFDADLPGGLGDGHFELGLITWTRGPNAGFQSEVRTYTDTGRVFELMLPTPFEIAQDDEFEVSPGCDRLHATCITKFGNIENNRGYKWIPGTDRTLRAPVDV